MRIYFKHCKNLVVYALRLSILLIYFFFLTPAVFAFVFFILFGLHCDIENSLLHKL